MLPERTRTYLTPISDSGRWDRFALRRGDILVCTPVKSGTTWTQMLCAMLVHQSTSFPEPLNRLSRWLERHRDPLEEAVAAFEAQPYRRIIKTHTPLDGVPYHPEAFYVFCGRDPRDVFLSMRDHMANGSDESVADARRRAGLPEDFVPPDDPNVLFTLWLTTGAAEGLEDGYPMGSVMSLTQTYWRFRALPNLHFLHYADLAADLDGELRGLARFLGTPIDEAKWPEFLRAASFEAMRARRRARPGGAFPGVAEQSRFLPERAARPVARRPERREPGALRAARERASRCAFEGLARRRAGRRRRPEARVGEGDAIRTGPSLRCHATGQRRGRVTGAAPLPSAP